MPNKTDDTPMTQEELMIALDKVYCAEKKHARNVW